MQPKIQWKLNTMPKSGDRQLTVMALDEVARAQAFHKSFPQYTEIGRASCRERV